MCGGHISGVEAAVQATRSAFELEDNEAMLLVDATNAFNALNRQLALHNIRRLCPAIATILINTYRNPTDLFAGGDILLSREGTTQGDPLAMPMYGLATMPIINNLDGMCTQIWYADDSAAIGTVKQLHGWWEKLKEIGSAFGYYPNPAKQDYFTPATNIFSGSGVNITPRGRPYLGSAIGTREYVEEYVSTKVNDWVSCVNTLSDILPDYSLKLPSQHSPMAY